MIALTREHLAEVADVYAKALAAGTRPAVAVAERWNVSGGTAHRWAHRARAEGLLAPTRQGLASGDEGLRSVFASMAAELGVGESALRASLRKYSAVKIRHPAAEEEETVAGRRANEIGDVGRNVAANVRRFRVGQGLTTEQLAGRVAALRPMYATTITKIEKEDRRVDVDDLVAIAQALNVPPMELLAAAPECRTCLGNPPAGFQCRTCGAGA